MSQRRRLRRQLRVAALVELPGGEETAHGCVLCRSVERRQELTSGLIQRGDAITGRVWRVQCEDCAAQWEVRFSSDASDQAVVTFSPSLFGAVLQ